MSPSDETASPKRSLIWRRQDDAGFEHFRLYDAPGGFDLVGRVIVAEQGKPLTVDYRLRACNGWRSREVEVTQNYDGVTRRMQMAKVDDEWWVGAHDRVDLSSCMDIDLAITPATNVLPIRRLGLKVGASADIQAAWVQFPSLEIVATPQRYERLGERRWRYSGLATDFTAELEVDEDGLPVEYEGIWSRIADLPGN
ncbi:putative glycolipid-binding domain-containing protein [Caulobacter sp. 17J80-11]|uniref:putative glycolipid-binding domain-containing protein n=1 Tax=Caulobacter sp. 17J80-11 TaxID=2763502 RepID=UPI0016539612|nr:putative glycolipid-binding domain-containing protein [Caulobacter sp. 17J80-11]MBC6983264.1 putative glycolipid-binding domain-containing protein [Caulobacter sp. 17J80-11]